MSRATKIVVVVVVLGLLAFAGWYFLVRDDAPSAVSLEDAVSEVDGSGDASASASGTDDASATETETGATSVSTTADSASASEGLDGTWTVDTETGDFDYESATGSFVGFRVDEELSSIGSTTAVGRTGEIEGSLTVDGDSVTQVEMEANMASIETNESRRDDKARQALKTDQYPTATFTLTDPITLPDGAAAGDQVAVEGTGDLTVAGVTKPVTLEIEAQLVDNTMVIVATTDVKLSDFDVEAPSAPIVLSVSDEATIEMKLLMVKG